MCPICKWDCLPIDLRRERDVQQHQEHQEQEQEQQDQQQQQDPPNDSFAVNMDVPGPSALVPPHTTEQTRNTTGNIIPRPILPAASPPASNQYNENPFSTASSSAINSPAAELNEKRNRNPFEGSQISETNGSIEQATAPIANVPAFTSVDLSSEPKPTNEKKPPTKDQ
jgi:transcription initiation factor TFIID subunit TAF12